MDKQSRLWMSYERIMQVKARLYVYYESWQILTDTMKSKKKISLETKSYPCIARWGFNLSARL